jgi:hypothetical protein
VENTAQKSVKHSSRFLLELRGDSMMFPKRSQAGRQHRPRLKLVDMAECDLQQYTDDYLTVRGIDTIRVPATDRLDVMRGELAGLPDNTCSIPITDKYALTLSLELKTRSQLHGRQVRNAVAQRWTIAQTPSEVRAAVDTFIADADRIRKILADRGCAD